MASKHLSRPTGVSVGANLTEGIVPLPTRRNRRPSAGATLSRRPGIR